MHKHVCIPEPAMSIPLQFLLLSPRIHTAINRGFVRRIPLGARASCTHAEDVCRDPPTLSLARFEAYEKRKKRNRDSLLASSKAVSRTPLGSTLPESLLP